jgi:adenylate cyclase
VPRLAWGTDADQRLMHNHRINVSLAAARWSSLGVVLVTLTGLAFWLLPVGSVIDRLSFDLLLTLRGPVPPPPEVIIVYLDEPSAEVLQQPIANLWDRSLHTLALARWHADGARLIYYDITFSERPLAERAPNAAVDSALADAMRAHGCVIVGAKFDVWTTSGIYQERIIPPAKVFEDAVAGWGLLLFHPVDPDYGVRQLTTGRESAASASWVAAEKLGGVLGKRSATRWLNFYGPAGAFRSVSFYQVVREGELPPGFFKDKIVLVGARPVASSLSAERDEFAHPASRWGRPFMTGVEIHATEVANLWRGEWLQRLSPLVEVALLLGLGFLIGLAANTLSPARSLFALVGVALVTLIGAYLLLAPGQLWFNWLIPVAIQVPLAAAWSTGTQYFTEARRRRALRDAFSLYLCEHMADRVAETDYDLQPSARLVEATMMFTDCQGFSAVAEELNDPVRLSALLSAYFTQTSRCVFECDGTILKYIGDAIMAMWGAPVAQPDHAYYAALAAYRLSEVAKLPVMGRVLTTRVGLSSGNVAAGNLGASFRFDYTAVGDVVNLASRLEGVNKLFGTRVLISENTHQLLTGRFLARPLGRLTTAGKSQGICVYELLGPIDQTAVPPWFAPFAKAVEAVQAGHFEEATVRFRETVWNRGGADGPSEFYLRYMQELASRHELAAWAGSITLKEK